MFSYMQKLLKQKREEASEERLIRELNNFKQRTESLNHLRNEMKDLFHEQELDEREKLLRELSITYKTIIDIEEMK